MLYENIIFENKNGVCWITLNRPKVLNALDPNTWTEIGLAVRHADQDDSVRVVVLTGAGGKAFAAGADIAVLKKRSMVEALKIRTHSVLNDITSCTKPVIAAIDGFALGGGCELALACDIRIATQKSKLGLPETSLGIIPGCGGTQRLQRLVGSGRAKELIFTGDFVSAAEAYRIGLVNKIVEDGKLVEAVEEMAGKIIEKGPVAISLAKAAVNIAENTDINSGLNFEKYAISLAFATQDKVEGTTAFLEKRKPKFQGY